MTQAADAGSCNVGVIVATDAPEHTAKRAAVLLHGTVRQALTTAPERLRGWVTTVGDGFQFFFVADQAANSYGTGYAGLILGHDCVAGLQTGKFASPAGLPLLALPEPTDAPGICEAPLVFDHIAVVLGSSMDLSLTGPAGWTVDPLRSGWVFDGLGTRTEMLRSGCAAVEVNAPISDGIFSRIAKRFGPCVVAPVLRVADTHAGAAYWDCQKNCNPFPLAGARAGGEPVKFGAVVRTTLDESGRLPVYLWRGAWPT